jgi:hypothetical protein
MTFGEAATLKTRTRHAPQNVTVVYITAKAQPPDD